MEISKGGQKKAGGRKPAQPSIPEGILGFLPPDTPIHRKPNAILKYLKTRSIAPDLPGKKVPAASKFFGALNVQVTHEMSARRPRRGGGAIRQRSSDPFKCRKARAKGRLPAVSRSPIRSALPPEHPSRYRCSGNARTQCSGVLRSQRETCALKNQTDSASAARCPA